MLALRHPSVMLMIGPSQSGKTTLIRNMISKKIFGPNIKRVKWCYSYPANWFAKENEIEFVRGFPERYEEGDLIIIDDLMYRLNEKIADLCTAAAHHSNLTVVIVLHNIFAKLKVMRDISLNSHYIVLFKNARDSAQINCLARQIYPCNSQFLMDAYIKATAKPYGYLVVDLHPKTTEEFRLRDNFFPDENGIYWLFRPK